MITTTEELIVTLSDHLKTGTAVLTDKLMDKIHLTADQVKEQQQELEERCWRRESIGHSGTLAQELWYKDE